MCSCSGSCNCNSTTIPRGPQGAPGTNGTNGTNGLQGPQGPQGLTGATGGIGATGPAGISAFTTLLNDFVQPAINSSNNITVVNNTWMAIGEIIYIGPAPSGLPVEAGGFYQVTAKSGIDGVTIVNLGWVIPGTTFIAPTSTVGALGTIVTPSGTIGAPGVSGSSVIDAKWGNYSGGGGTNDFKTSIAVPLNTLVSTEDILECQTVFRVLIIDGGDRDFFIKISPNNTTTTAVLAVEVTLDPTILPPGTESRIHMNYKIQRTGRTTFRSKAEIFYSFGAAFGSVFDVLSKSTYMYTTTANVTLAASSSWEQEQCIVAGANDTVSPGIYVINHEVKVVKKLI